MDDKKRDEYTKPKGWKVFRIAWKEFQAAPDEIMLMFGEFIEKNLPERSYSIDEIKKQYSTKSSTAKYGSRKAYFDHLREENLQKNQSKIELVKYSQIAFSKLGWVTRVADLIKITPQKVRKWMKRYLPDVEKISYRRN